MTHCSAVSCKLPLGGRRVVVTRAAEQAGELAACLERLGAEVLLLPMIQFTGPDDPTPLDRALAGLGDFDWLLLTSQNAVRFVAERARAIGMNLAARLAQASSPRVAVVGATTEQAARGEAWRVDFVSPGRGGRDMVEALREEMQGKRVLLPRSDRATNDLPRALADRGASATIIVAYKTVVAAAPDETIIRRIADGEVDVVSFTSPSAFQGLAEQLGARKLREIAGRTRLAAIGPTTGEAIRRAGLKVTVEANVSTAAGLAEAIAAYFKANPERFP